MCARARVRVCARAHARGVVWKWGEAHDICRKWTPFGSSVAMMPQPLLITYAHTEEPSSLRRV